MGLPNRDIEEEWFEGDVHRYSETSRNSDRLRSHYDMTLTNAIST
jgi:hypothetical protein